jgi:hypothetical protein
VAIYSGVVYQGLNVTADTQQTQLIKKIMIKMKMMMMVV